MAKPSLTVVPASSPLDMFEDLIEGENMLDEDESEDEEEGEEQPPEDPHTPPRGKNKLH